MRDKKPKYLYKKIKEWKKKPSYDGLISGFIFCIAAAMTISFLSMDDGGNVFLTVIFTLMFVFGVKLMIKSSGEDQRTYYIKISRKIK